VVIPQCGFAFLTSTKKLHKMKKKNQKKAQVRDLKTKKDAKGGGPHFLGSTPSGGNLSGGNLSGGNLSGGNLSGGNLSGGGPL
jgi:uncharacterized protein YjbI with pentapeptide repeats